MGKVTKLRVWHIPQVPMKPFYVYVQSVEEAWKVLNILWDYDIFQYENKVKPDYANASGLAYFDEAEQEWFEWTDDEGYDIREHFENMDYVDVV